MLNKNKRIKVMAALLIIILLILGLYIVYSIHGLNQTKIGKTISINFENVDADYLQMLLESKDKHDPTNKVALLDKAAVEQVIQYMRGNNVKIVSGYYEIPQTSGYEGMMNLLKFEPKE